MGAIGRSEFENVYLTRRPCPLGETCLNGSGDYKPKLRYRAGSSTEVDLDIWRRPVLQWFSPQLPHIFTTLLHSPLSPPLRSSSKEESALFFLVLRAQRHAVLEVFELWATVGYVSISVERLELGTKHIARKKVVQHFHACWCFFHCGMNTVKILLFLLHSRL